MPTTGSAKSIQENLILVQNILQKHVTLTNFNKCSTSYTLKTEEKELLLGGTKYLGLWCFKFHQKWPKQSAISSCFLGNNIKK